MKRLIRNRIIVRMILLIASLVFLLAAAGYAAYLVHAQSASGAAMIESRENEMKELPESMKRIVRLRSLTATFRIPVIMYHYVEYVQDRHDTIRKSLDTTPDVFEAQVETLRDAGYTFLTASDLADILYAKKDLPDKPVLLTFDDGYRDFYTDVFPILRRHGVRATAFIVPGFLDQPNYMFRSQVADLVKSGLVEIGAHTVHHMYLKGLPAPEVRSEVVGSKRMLEDEFHVPVISFAYPYGAFDRQTVEIAGAAGFLTAASTLEGTAVSQQNRLFFPRIRAGYMTGDVLLSFLRAKTSE